MRGAKRHSRFKQVEGQKIFFKKLFVKSAILGVQINAFCAMSERSFIMARITRIKTKDREIYYPP